MEQFDHNEPMPGSHDWSLFADIRARFDQPGIERGGCPRAGVTPVYVRKFGAHAATIFPQLETVESSFTAEQLQAVNSAILALKHAMNGNSTRPSFAQRIVEQFLAATQPYFLQAQLRAIEAVLSDGIANEPQHAPAIDALFRVAGSEGLRDLIRLYDARTLLHQVAHTTGDFPDILAFVNIHERSARDGAVKRFEVWCPGYDFAKTYHQHCLEAAQQLTNKHNISSAPTLEAEVQQLPIDLVAHFSQFVQRKAGHRPTNNLS